MALKLEQEKREKLEEKQKMLMKEQKQREMVEALAAKSVGVTDQSVALPSSITGKGSDTPDCTYVKRVISDV